MTHILRVQGTREEVEVALAASASKVPDWEWAYTQNALGHSSVHVQLNGTGCHLIDIATALSDASLLR